MMNKINNQLGIYIHIPFCVQKCNYCDFLSYLNSAAHEASRTNYIYALVNEMRALKDKYSSYLVKSVFVGGGTPSILSPKELELLFRELRDNFNIKEEAEFTIECNPGTISGDKIQVFNEYEINRISLGLQSADNKELKELGRIHSYEDFLKTYDLLRTKSFNNINIDLMSALPNQTLKSWENTLNKIILLRPEHISAYSLIVEEGTNLYERIREEETAGIYSLPSEDVDREMYYATGEILRDAGYLHYEISNYSLAGFECRHNISYWIRDNYLGLGLGSASLINNVRYSNITDIKDYIKNSSNPKRIQENINVLTENEQMEEFMFLGLRLIDGISIKDFDEKFNIKLFDIYKDIIEDLEEKKLVKMNEDRISLSKKGIDLSNYVLAQFLID